MQIPPRVTSLPYSQPNANNRQRLYSSDAIHQNNQMLSARNNLGQPTSQSLSYANPQKVQNISKEFHGVSGETNFGFLPNTGNVRTQLSLSPTRQLNHGTAATPATFYNHNANNNNNLPQQSNPTPGIYHQFSQYYQPEPGPNNLSINHRHINFTFQSPISSIEPHLERLTADGDNLNRSIQIEAKSLQQSSANNKRLDNYFNKMPSSSQTIYNEAIKLSQIQKQQMGQIREQFQRSLRIKLRTPNDIMNRQRQLENKINSLERLLKDKRKAHDKLAAKSSNNQSQANQLSRLKMEIDRIQEELIILVENLRNPPKPESRNDILGQSVTSVLYPASYDYLIRSIKYSKVWIQQIQNHQNFLESLKSQANLPKSNQNQNQTEHLNNNNNLNILKISLKEEKILQRRNNNHSPVQNSYNNNNNNNNISNSQSPNSSSNINQKSYLVPISDGSNQQQYQKEMQEIFEEFYKLEIVDKPD